MFSGLILLILVFMKNLQKKRVLVLQQIFPCLIIRFDSIVKKYYIFFNNT